MKIMFHIFLILTLPLFAQAEEINDSAVACALQDPAEHRADPLEDGIDPDDLVSAEIASGTNFSATVGPTVQLDWDSGEKITNLTDNPESRPRTLVFGDFRRGFQAVDFANNTRGLGAQIPFAFGNTTGLASSLWASIGLLPVKGSEVKSIRYFPDRRSLDRRSEIPALQHSLHSLENLAPADVLAYTTKGGMVFFAGVGVSLIGVQTVGIAQGEFQVYVEKYDANNVYVKITESDLKTFGIKVGSLFSHLSVSKFSQYGNSLGFLINFRDSTGIRAYKDLIRGNVAPIQKLAMDSNQAVRFWDESRHSRIGTSTQFAIGIPFLFNLSWSKGKYFDVLRKRFYACERSLAAVYGTYFKRKEKKIGSREEQFTKIFYGASYSLKGNDKATIARGLFGQSLLTYEATDGSAKHLMKAMRKLSAITGLGNLVMLNVPERSSKMNYTGLKLRTQFSAQNTQNLVRRASSTSRSRLSRMVNRLIAQSGDRTALCSGVDFSSDGDGISVISGSCEAGLSSKTEAGIEEMLSAIRDLSYALKRGNERKATLAYAKFGEAMLTNQFTFKLGLMMAGDGLKMDYIVEGSDYSYYLNTLRSDGESGNMVRDSRAPIYRDNQGRGRRVGELNQHLFALGGAEAESESVNEIFVVNPQ